MMILRLFFGPRSAQQAALKGPQLPEMFWVPQGRGWDAFPNSQGSLLSIAPTQALDPNTFLKLSQDYQPWILFIHSFIQQILLRNSFFLLFLKTDFPGGTKDINLPADAGDMGWIPAVGTFHMPPCI